jgi:hypothetical protein
MADSSVDIRWAVDIHWAADIHYFVDKTVGMVAEENLNFLWFADETADVRWFADETADIRRFADLHDFVELTVEVPQGSLNFHQIDSKLNRFDIFLQQLVCCCRYNVHAEPPRIPKLHTKK